MFYFETELLLCTVMLVGSLPANSTQLLAPNASMLILLSQLLALFVSTDWSALSCLHNFKKSVFNKEDQKLNEKLLYDFLILLWNSYQ